MCGREFGAVISSSSKLIYDNRVSNPLAKLSLSETILMDFFFLTSQPKIKSAVSSMPVEVAVGKAGRAGRLLAGKGLATAGTVDGADTGHTA